MGEEKTLENVPGLNPDEKVVIKKLGYGGLTKLRGQSTNSQINPVTGAISASLDLGLFSKWMVILGVKEAPFFKNCKTVDERESVIDNDTVSSDTGEFLFKSIQEFNNFTGFDAKKKN